MAKLWGSVASRRFVACIFQSSACISPQATRSTYTASWTLSQDSCSPNCLSSLLCLFAVSMFSFPYVFARQWHPPLRGAVSLSDPVRRLVHTYLKQLHQRNPFLPGYLYTYLSLNSVLLTQAACCLPLSFSRLLSLWHFLLYSFVKQLIMNHQRLAAAEEPLSGRTEVEKS